MPEAAHRRATVVGDRGAARLAPFDAVELDLAAIWPEASAI